MRPPAEATDAEAGGSTRDYLASRFHGVFVFERRKCSWLGRLWLLRPSFDPDEEHFRWSVPAGCTRRSGLMLPG